MKSMEWLDINQELEKIIEKYNIDRHYPAYRTSRQACAYLKKWIENLSDTESTVLFISMDDRARFLIRSWSTGNNISTLQISSVEELSEHIEEMQNTDKIYIVSYSRTIEILHWLWRHNFQAESVYDMLENQHIYLQMEFHRFFAPINISAELDLRYTNTEHSIDGSSFVLYEYYYQKQRLLHSQSEWDCERIREKLFFLSLCMKNFVEAQRILKTMTDNVDYERCWCDIEILLHKIEDTLRLNEQKHIIIYWMDALDYKTAQEMEYFSERSDHSICFTNAFTVTPYTLPTCKTMFCNILQVDDLGYKIRHIGLDDSPLLQDIMKQGYDFRVIGRLALYFDEKYNYSGAIRKDAPCSEVFWNLAGQIIQNNQPTVYLVHALIELHSPWLSVQRNRFEKKYAREERENQVKELNAQLRFYDNILGDSFYRIYMGDHGSYNHANNINFNLHIQFQIYHSTWEKQIWNKLFCYLDFPILMHQLLIKGNIDEVSWNREFVPVQDVDYYNYIDLKQNLLKCLGLELQFLKAYKGIITNDYIYLYFKDGDEIFHKWIDGDGLYMHTMDPNNSQKNPALYKELREKTGEFPKELDTDSKFEHSKNIYIIFENVKKTVKKAIELLNDKLAEYPDRGIALRAGGNHTLWLLSMLTESSKKKIGGIIDNNPLCLCKDLGYTIYSSYDRLPDSIKAILLSTYDYLETLRAEAENIYPNLEVINIYRYWETCGYHFTGNFWTGLKEDWNIAFLES